jgi:hypothetical protein
VNAVYFQNDDPGKLVAIAGRGGRQIQILNPDTGIHDLRTIQVAGGQPGGVQQSLFNGSAHIDGVPGQSLQAGKVYYSYVFLPPNNTPATLPIFNFTERGFTSVPDRYAFNSDTGNAEWTDPQGNQCSLVGMCYVVADQPGYPSSGNTVASVFWGYPPTSPSAPRILTSPAPWLHNAAQPLPATTGMAGGSISGATLSELNPQYHRIIACAWAWRGVWSLLTGYAQPDTAGATIIIQVRARPLFVPGATYITAATCQATAAQAGHSVPLIGQCGVALNDGAYEFSVWASCSAGSASYNITHTLHGWT